MILVCYTALFQLHTLFESNISTFLQTEREMPIESVGWRVAERYSNQLTLHIPAPIDLLKLYKIFVFLVINQSIQVAISDKIYNVSFLPCSEHARGATVAIIQLNCTAYV